VKEGEESGRALVAVRKSIIARWSMPPRPFEYKDSVSAGKPELLQSFLGFTGLFTFGHDRKDSRSMLRSCAISSKRMMADRSAHMSLCKY
jgi:hypothetical protein